jgi:hypothetical protein
MMAALGHVCLHRVRHDNRRLVSAQRLLDPQPVKGWVWDVKAITRIALAFVISSEVFIRPPRPILRIASRKLACPYRTVLSIWFVPIPAASASEEKMSSFVQRAVISPATESSRAVFDLAHRVATKSAPKPSVSTSWPSRLISNKVNRFDC